MSAAGSEKGVVRTGNSDVDEANAALAVLRAPLEAARAAARERIARRRAASERRARLAHERAMGRRG